MSFIEIGCEGNIMGKFPVSRLLSITKQLLNTSFVLGIENSIKDSYNQINSNKYFVEPPVCFREHSHCSQCDGWSPVLKEQTL